MKRKVVIFSSFLVFILLFLLYKLDLLELVDNSVYSILINIKSDFITNLMKIITFFGSTKFVVVLMILFFVISVRYKKFYIINIIIVGEVLLNNIVKNIVRRDRPLLINLVDEKSFSFPSGHTMVSVVLYGFIIYLLIKSNLNKKFKFFGTSFLIILIILIMLSRIYLGVHYFSDVLAGMCLALAYLLICIEIVERKRLL